MSVSFCSAYLFDVYSPKEYKKIVARVTKAIRKQKKILKFQAIAFTGSSGAALAYPISFITKIPLIHVRKGKSHGNSIEGGNHDIERYVILDDLIDTGATVKRIFNKIKQEGEVECVGILLYDSCRINTSSFSFNSKVSAPIKRV